MATLAGTLEVEPAGRVFVRRGKERLRVLIFPPDLAEVSKRHGQHVTIQGRHGTFTSRRKRDGQIVNQWDFVADGRGGS